MTGPLCAGPPLDAPVVPPAAGADNPGVQDRPEAQELAAAVAEFLSAQVRPAVPEELRFLVLVAANACAILAREAESMAAAPADELRRLSALLGHGGPGIETEEGNGSPERLAWELRSRLAARIRAGELDDRWDEAVGALRDSVRAKLAVAHPGYDDFADDGRGTTAT